MPIFLAALSLAFASAGYAGLPMRAEVDPDQPARVLVYAGDDLFTVYKTATDQKYPYFYPVNGPRSGASVTTESSEPYPHHHSLFFGCDKVNGGNYWQDTLRRGQIVSEGVRIVEAAGGRVVLEEATVWRRPGKEPVMRDRRRIAVFAPDADTRVIDFEITLEPQDDVRVEKTNHSLFSARMVEALSVKAGGTLVNAAGESGEAETFGKRSPWMDYRGTRNGVVEGLAILQHPDNPWYPAPWFTRDYGFFSPTPMYWPENDRHIDLPKSKPVTLRYRVVVHAGEADLAQWFKQYAGDDAE